MDESTQTRQGLMGLVTPLDDLRTKDTGVLASFGGAVTSGVLYSIQSGTELYVSQLFAQAHSGQGGYIRLLDGTTQRTGPIFVSVSGAPPGGPVVLATKAGPFRSGLNVETVSSAVLPNGTTLFAGHIWVEVQVDPRLEAEGS